MIVCVHAQNYTIDHVFENSQNSRIGKNGRYGLVDKNKIILIPPTYDKVDDFHNGFAKVVRLGQIGFVNMKAEEIIPCMYEEDTMMIIGAVAEHAIDVTSLQESIFVSTDERREGFNEDMVCVIKNGKYGFVDKLNKIIIPFQYDGSDNFYNGIAIIKEKNKYGAIDKAGKTVIPVTYDLLVWDFSETPVIYTQKDGKSFLLDKNGNRVWKRGNE
jgi:hypothetical protein